jgi:hypothetical protein
MGKVYCKHLPLWGSTETGNRTSFLNVWKAQDCADAVVIMDSLQ